MKQKITTFLTFNTEAEAAVKFYTSIFADSKINSISYYPESFPNLGGKAMSISFELNNQTFYALNAGSGFKFEQGISLLVNCKNQEEVDHYWDKLTDGGEAIACGWLKDKYGISWQITPEILLQHMDDEDKTKSKRVMDAMMKMVKIDIATIEKAYNGE
jgi:predicted 3-demethylubiquinone-9 3-methyltransferase (glyoxalase superfamily)